MPDRILKESICVSEKISSLSDFEYRIWTGLILIADDLGRGDARPAIIKGRAFPLRERITVKDIDVAVHGLAAKGCVSLYTVGGRPYFWFPTWSKHQRVKDAKSKYPSPEDSDQYEKVLDKNHKTSNYNQTQSQSKSNISIGKEPKVEENLDFSDDIFISLPLNDKTFFDVEESQVKLWAELFPSVNVKQQLREMYAWLDSNPAKRKTRSGIKSFITRWLSKKQDQGGCSSARDSNNDTARAANDDQDMWNGYKLNIKHL